MGSFATPRGQVDEGAEGPAEASGGARPSPTCARCQAHGRGAGEGVSGDQLHSRAQPPLPASLEAPTPRHHRGAWSLKHKVSDGQASRGQPRHATQKGASLDPNFPFGPSPAEPAPNGPPTRLVCACGMDRSCTPKLWNCWKIGGQGRDGEIERPLRRVGAPRLVSPFPRSPAPRPGCPERPVVRGAGSGFRLCAPSSREPGRLRWPPSSGHCRWLPVFELNGVVRRRAWAFAADLGLGVPRVLGFPPPTPVRRAPGSLCSPQGLLGSLEC